MSNKSSPRRRSANKRYDEDYEYYVPVRYYKGKNEANEETEMNENQEAKRKRGRPAGIKNYIICVEYFDRNDLLF